MEVFAHVLEVGGMAFASYLVYLRGLFKGIAWCRMFLAYDDLTGPDWDARSPFDMFYARIYSRYLKIRMS